MKIICKDKVIDLSKFETVRYRESFLGNSSGYPVEAIRNETSNGLFGGTCTVTEEIARFSHKEGADALVKSITNAWIEEAKLFDVLKWNEEVVSGKSTGEV